MAHLAPHLRHHHHHHHQQPPTAAIFSPSVARAAASTAKDWSYVDDWLRRKYGKRHNNNKVPSFERNPDTLRALLALAAANEAADEERAQLFRIEEAALEEERRLKQQQQQEREQQKRRGRERRGRDGDEEEQEQEQDGAQVAEDILAAIEAGLSREGRAALDAMAGTAAELGEAAPTPRALAAAFVELQGRLCEAQLAAERVALLRDYLEGETAQVEGLLRRIRGGGGGGGGGGRDESSPPPPAAAHPRRTADAGPDPGANADPEAARADADADAAYDDDDDDDAAGAGLGPEAATLARRNLALQRAVREAAARLPGLRRQAEAVERAAGGDPPATVAEVRADEAAHRRLLDRRRALDARVAAFAGLPPDVAAARAELDARRARLRALSARRDGDFERLVERESPVKLGLGRNGRGR